MQHRRFLGWAMATAVAGVLFAGPASGQPAPGGAVTLEAALGTAFAHSPELAAAEAAVIEARGRATTAGTFPNNPVLSGEAGARLGPDPVALDWALGLEQAVPLSRKGTHRRAVGSAELEAARATREATGQVVSARVRIAFVEALRARELVAIEETQVDLARKLVSVAEKRFAAGASARLDVNLARVDAGRAAGRLNGARSRYAVARALLAESMGVRPSEGPAPEGTLDAASDVPLPPVAELVALAGQNRHELRAVDHLRQAARARVELAAAEGVPELGVSVFFRREAATETIAGGGLSIPLPVFDRNEGPVAEARASERRADADRALQSVQIERQVVAALSELGATQATALALQSQVVGTLEENLGLLQQAFESGKVAGTEVLVFRQQFRDSRIELVDALASAWLARIQLEAAVGRLPGPTAHTQEIPR